MAHTPFRIFLASAAALATERTAIEVRINRVNKQWAADGIFLHLEIWEDLLATVSPTRKQDDYNAALQQCDLFVILVHHRLGKYSAEEFGAAHASFKARQRPHMLVYLKDPPAPGATDPGPDYASVRNFNRRLFDIGHFPTPYQHVAELVDHLVQQLQKLRDQNVITAAPAGADASDASAAPGKVGSGAQATGPHGQAASRGGINVGRDNNGTAITAPTHTQGGAFFAGPVTVGGNLAGRDYHQTAFAPAAATPAAHPAPPAAEDWARALQALQQAIQAQVPPAHQPVSQEVLEELATEAAKPPAERSDKRMARLLDGLVDLVPEGVKALAGQLLGPLVGGLSGPFTAAVLAKLLGSNPP